MICVHSILICYIKLGSSITNWQYSNYASYVPEVGSMQTGEIIYNLWDKYHYFKPCFLIIWYVYRPKDAAKAIRKRLSGNKNFKSVLLTLTVSVVTESYNRFSHTCIEIYHSSPSKPWGFFIPFSCYLFQRLCDNFSTLNMDKCWTFSQKNSS